MAPVAAAAVVAAVAEAGYEGRAVRPGVKLAGFAVVLAAAFGVGAAVGAVAGPIEVDGADDHTEVHDEGPPATTVVHPAGHEAAG